MDSLCSCDHALMSSGRLFKAHIDDSHYENKSIDACSLRFSKDLSLSGRRSFPEC